MKTKLIACAVATAALLLSSATAPQIASADDKLDRARSHYERGVELFNQSNYKGAIAEFAAADGIAPSPILEYNMALCYDRLGERSEALRRYRIYLKRVPNAANRSVVDQKIARLEKLAREEAAGTPEPEPYETLPEPEPTEPNPNTTNPPDTTPTPTEPPIETRPAKTGDPELDRVAGINVGAIRDERGLGGAGAGAIDNEVPPAAPNGKAEAGVPVKDPGNQPKPKPIYKRWWFWVVVGVSAIILIDIASSGNDDTNARILNPGLDAAMGGRTTSGGGFTVRF